MLARQKFLILAGILSFLIGLSVAIPRVDVPVSVFVFVVVSTPLTALYGMYAINRVFIEEGFNGRARLFKQLPKALLLGLFIGSVVALIVFALTPS